MIALVQIGLNVSTVRATYCTADKATDVKISRDFPCIDRSEEARFVLTLQTTEQVFHRFCKNKRGQKKTMCGHTLRRTHYNFIALHMRATKKMLNTR